MKERILHTLEAYLITNEDVLEADEIKDIKEQIQVVKAYNEKSIKVKLKKIAAIIKE